MGLYEDSLAAFRSGATGQAEELALELLSQARDGGDVRDEVDGLCMLARVALRRGDYEHVIALAGEARAVARRAGEPRLARMPIHMLAVGDRMRHDYSEARVLYEESIALNLELGEEHMVASEYRNLAYVELHDGHTDRARHLFGSAADLVRKGHFAALEPFLLLDAAVVAFEDGYRDRAAQLAISMQAAVFSTGQILDPDDAAEQDDLQSRLREM
jgi:tetratricopeptide (TPR) repeat protein